VTARRYTEDELRAAVADAEVRTMADLCRRLGLVPRGGNDETVRAYARAVGVDLSAFDRPHVRRPTKHLEPIDAAQLAATVAAATSCAEALRRLGWDGGNTGRRRLRQAIQQHGLSTDHWLGQRWARGRSFPERRRPVEQYLVRGKLVSSTYLRTRLIEEGVLAARCSRCGLAEWQGVPIPLELDHVNGDRRDNRLENLRLLCPNCHALTPTYRGRNIGRQTPDATPVCEAPTLFDAPG
jgi:hypothetical protein